MAAKNQLQVLLFLPGTLFWVLIVAGAMTKDNRLIGAGVGLGVFTVISAMVFKLRASGQARDARKRVWQEGHPARARVVSLAQKGATNQDPLVVFELDVQRDGAPAYRVRAETLVSQLAIPRVQPDCEIAVRIDPRDAQHVVVDPALTPYPL